MVDGFKLPLSESQQKEILDILTNSENKINSLERKNKHLIRDNEYLTTANENADRIREYNEKEILKNKQKVEQISRAKSTFLSQMSHEIRTPMNAIQSLSELLLRTELTRQQREYVRNVVNSSELLIHTIRDILDFTKLYSEEIEVMHREYNFTNLLTDVANSVYLKVIDTELTFITEVDSSIPSKLIGDERFVKQILMNVLSNAIKYTEKGHVKLTITANESDIENSVNLEFIIEDTGIGISKSDRDRLFHSFFNEVPQAGGTHESAGLGLIICKKLCDLMDGEIHLTSTTGKGTKFYVTLPQEISSDEPIVYIENLEEKRVLVLGNTSQCNAIRQMLIYMNVSVDIYSKDNDLADCLSNENYTHIVYFYDECEDIIKSSGVEIDEYVVTAIKDLRFAGTQLTKPSINTLLQPLLVHELAEIINKTQADILDDDEIAEEEVFIPVNTTTALVVDDNDVNLFVLEQILNQYDIYPTLSESGADAVEVCKSEKFDIIFMDHMMPGMDGVEASRLIREIENGPNRTTPIIMATANAVVGAKEEYIAEGLSDFISKPIDIKELEHILDVWLPKEKIEVKTIVIEDDDDTEYPDFIKSLESLDIDGKAAYKSIGKNENIYLAIVDTFIQSAPEILENLETYSHEKQIDAYRIEVHGIKSALANIGAKPLSEVARKLEVSAQKADINFINDYSRGFIYDVKELIKNIIEVLPTSTNVHEDITASETPISADDFLVYLGALEMLLNNLESYEASNALNEITTKLNQEQMDKYVSRLNQIKTNIKNFNYDSAIVKIKQMTEELTLA